jgi:hypothetical protein
VLQNGFVNWDDPVNFLNNPAYRGRGLSQLKWLFTTFHMGHYITLGADYLVWGMDPTGYHLTSLLFHAATALCFYAVARRLLARTLPARAAPSDIALGAAAAALLFAVHPLRVESVAWITERRDVVSGLFFMLALLSWLKQVDAPRAVRLCWYAASLGFFGCALLSKALAVGLPVVLVVLDVYPLCRLGTPRDGLHRDVVKEVWLEKIPYVVMAIVASGLAMAATPASAKAALETLSLGSRALVAAYGLAFYLVKTVVPVGLSPLYAFVTSVSWVVVAGLAMAVMVVVAMRRQWPAVAAAGVVYVALILPPSASSRPAPS